jgi:hypothetical protein
VPSGAPDPATAVDFASAEIGLAARAWLDRAGIDVTQLLLPDEPCERLAGSPTRHDHEVVRSRQRGPRVLERSVDRRQAAGEIGVDAGPWMMSRRLLRWTSSSAMRSFAAGEWLFAAAASDYPGQQVGVGASPEAPVLAVGGEDRVDSLEGVVVDDRRPVSRADDVVPAPVGQVPLRRRDGQGAGVPRVAQHHAHPVLVPRLARRLQRSPVLPIARDRRDAPAGEDLGDPLADDGRLAQ